MAINHPSIWPLGPPESSATCAAWVSGGLQTITRLNGKLSRKTLPTVCGKGRNSHEHASINAHKPGIRAGRYCGIERNLDRKSTRLNSSHVAISYAVFCLKKK